jgi:predicted nucleotidyltransferase
LAKEFGDYPKTHKIGLLFEELSKITEDAMSFYEKYAEYLGLLEEANITTRYFGKEYSHKSAEKALEVLGEFKEVFGSRLISVYVFGSVIEGKDKPMSDVDVAVVIRDSAGEEERMRLYKKVRKNFGLHPFEIHIVTPEEWENRYRRFVRRFVEI